MTDTSLPAAEPLIAAWIAQLKSDLATRAITRPRVIGIQTGGVLLAERVAAVLTPGQPIGRLDISFYRDDLGQHALNPSVRPSSLPWSIEQEHVLLVDDVLFSGRTIRAALNEIFDWGRPASVLLAVLVERNGRQLPIQADVAATRLTLPLDQHIKLRAEPNFHFELVHLGGRA